MSGTESRLFMDGRACVAQYDIRPTGIVYRNPGVESLYQAAVQRGQATTLANGALLQDTTPYFGRAAKSSFYVNDPSTRIEGKSLDELIAWGNPERGQYDNLPIGLEVYTRLRKRVIEHLSGAGDLYVTDAWSGRTETSRMGVRVITARAPSALFARNIFLRANEDELGLRARVDYPPCTRGRSRTRRWNQRPAFIITDLPGRTTIIGGTRPRSNQEIDFPVQNLLLPLKGILTRTGASEGSAGHSRSAGLSGTGKTTLSNTGSPWLMTRS